jgi:hypothetical protein
MRKHLPLPLCLAVALSAGAAWAQPPAAASSPDTQRETRAYAMCLARSRPRVAEDILALPYLGEEQTRRAAQRIAGLDTCLTDTDVAAAARAPSILEGMAVQLLPARLAGANLTEVSALTDDQVVAHGLRPRNGYEDFSLCMVRGQPALVRSFVLAAPGTPQAQAAFREIVPHVPNCVGEGQHLSLDQRGLRAVLAVGLFRTVDTLRPRS